LPGRFGGRVTFRVSVRKSLVALEKANTEKAPIWHRFGTDVCRQLVRERTETELFQVSVRERTGLNGHRWAPRGEVGRPCAEADRGRDLLFIARDGRAACPG
jgi:hypothetical protein